MKIFITGASGFVGGAAAKHLAKAHQVLAMARSAKSADKVQALGAEPVRCDLQTVKAADLAGCEVVIHAAAYAEEWGSYEDFFEANVVGTRKVIDAAKAAGVKRFVFIGTEAAMFEGKDLLGIDETFPYAASSPYFYSRTKAEAERLVLAENATDFVALSLRPRLVWGPGDQTVLPAVLAMIEKGQFAWIGGGQYQTSTAHIDNLVHAIELALTRGRGGEAYFIADDGVTSIREFLSSYIRSQGVEVPSRSLPRALARGAARAVDGIWRIFGIREKPPVVRFSVDMMSVSCTVDTSKARRELGYQPVISVAEGLRSMPRLATRD